MGAKPTYLSKIPRGTDISVADVGSALLGLGLHPQGVNVARVLEARDRHGIHLYPEVGVLIPRRGQKTTSIWSVLLGRCSTIPGYKVVTTAQDGTRAGEKIREVMEILAAGGFEENGLGDLLWSNGKERIKFANGSMLWVVAPKPGAFRSAAADCILFDEAGEVEVDKGEALMAGALPLMDTRPNPQVIVAGTPSRARAGLLWTTLEDGRASKPGTGIVDYSIKDDEPSVLIEDDGTITLNEKVLLRVHPGIGTLTTLAKMRTRFEKMQLPQFEMEYLCRFPLDNSTRAIDGTKWAASVVDPVERPDRVGIAFDCAIDSTSATIAYAWRDEDGNAYGEIVAHRPGTSWVAREAHKAGEKYRRTPIAYDDIGANRDPVTTLIRLKPTPKVDRLQMKDIMGAAQRLVSEVHEGRFRHFGQADLDEAVSNATWRDVLRSGRAFGSAVAHGPSINPLVALSLALWSYDKTKPRSPLVVVAS